MAIKIIVDQRERSVFDALESSENEYELRTIEIGDYQIWIDDGNPLNKKCCACIERKTLTDYAASIKDGRIKNISKMIELRALTNCQLYLIIEGNIFPNLSAKFAGIAYKAIETSIFRNMVKHNIQIIRSRNTSDTVHIINKLTNEMVLFNSTIIGRGESALIHARGKTRDEILLTALIGLPGIGKVTGKKIIADIIGIPFINILETIPAGLPSRAHASLHAIWICDKLILTKFLTKLPRISQTMAAEIVLSLGQDCVFTDLLNKNMINIKVNGRRIEKTIKVIQRLLFEL